MIELLFSMDILLIFFLLFTLLLAVTALVSIFLRIPYVPTKKKVIDKIFEEAEIKKGESFYDLGCGDARVLIQAEKRKKVKAIGYEIAPLIYLLAIIRKFISRSKANIYFKSYLNESLKNADVIFFYLTPNEVQKIAQKIKKECKKGTRIISNTFKIKGWKPKKIIEKNHKQRIPTLYFYQI